MLSSIIDFANEAFSIFPKLRNKAYYSISNTLSKKALGTKSDSEQLLYVKSLRKILQSESKFNRFRKMHNYKEILEHVSRIHGERYLNEIKETYPELLRSYDLYKRNDVFGKPRTFNYQIIGRTSPTTLRYVKTGAEILHTFQLKSNSSVVEIGAGYGGQALILNLMADVKKFRLVDIPEAEQLIQKYLSLVKIDTKEISFGISDVDEDYDLVISNYAFSELPMTLQQFYLEKILVRSKAGYLIMNSGRTNFTKRSEAKMSIEHLINAIPMGKIFRESPQTGADNYLFIWGAANTDNLKLLED